MIPENRIITLLRAATALLLSIAVFSLNAQDPDDYFVGHGFVGNGDTVFTNSGTFWDDGYTANYSTTGNWNVYFCTTVGNPNPLTVEFKGFATHYGGAFPAPPGAYAAWDYMTIQYPPSVSYVAYHDDTPEFSFTSQSGCIRFGLVKNGDAFTHDGWEAEIYAIPPPSNNSPCGAANLTVGNVCTPQVFTNKGAYQTGSYASPCHSYFGGDVWFTAVVPASGNLKIESFPGTLEWAVMNLYTGSSCTSLSHYACIEDSIGMPTAHLSGLTPGDTIYIRMFGDQAKSGTFGMCASDPTAQIEGHTGPGGVGDDSTNVLWLRADRGVMNNSDTDASDGEAVKTWQDQSGNANNITQVISGSWQPLLTDNAINGMPVLRFDGSDDYLGAELSSLSAPLTLITVSRFTDPGVDDHLMSMGNEVNTAKTVSVSRESDNRYYTYTDNGKWYGPALSDNTPYLIHAVHNISATYHELYLNEAGQSPSDYSASVVTDGTFLMGASRDTTNFLGGDVAEFIIYKQKLNDAQKIIVENFLAAKYGIGITTDKYAFEAVHGHDVAGIGQTDANNRHTEAQSDATISIGNPSDLDNGEFVLFGHDNGDISAWTATEIPNGDPNLKRIAREWRVNITGGDPGLLTLTLSDSLLPALQPGFENYLLWTDTDGDFSTGATAIPLVKVGENYVANSVGLSDSIYITIATTMPYVGFSQAASSGLESDASPAIEVVLNYALNEEVSVVFRAVDSTATGGGVDYLLNPGLATFPAGTTSTTIQPQVIDDTIVELPDEFFEIRLSDPDAGLNLSTDTVHTYTILNNDILVSAGTDTDTISDCGTASAGLSTAVTGTGPYTYAWTPSAGLSDPGIANPTATPAADTWYKVTVTDLTNGSSGSDSVHITVIPKPAKPTVTPVGSTTFCEGDSVLLSASDGYSWLWSNGKTTRDIYAVSTGSYTVKIIDIYGCESDPSEPQDVTVNPIPATPTISASGDTDFCPGDSVDLSSSDGDAYRWSNGETTKSIRVKTTGSFYVQTQSAAGCWSDTSLITLVTLKTPPAAPTITASGPTDFCLGDSVDLTASAGDTWLWSTGATAQTIRVKAAGSYTVQVTDATTCLSDPSAATVVTVLPVPPAPSITPGGSTDICENDSVELTSSPGAGYLWSTGATTEAIYANTAGDYSVRIINAEGCWSPSSPVVTISTNPVPGKPVISYTGPATFCQGDSLVLSSSVGDGYLWSTGETTQSISAKTTGSRTVRLVGTAGCLGPQSDPVVITVNPLPGKPLISGDSSYCEGGSANLSSTAATVYNWSTGETSQSISAAAGSYTVSVSDANGCGSPPSDPFTVTEYPKPPKPVVTASGPTTFWSGDSVILSSSPAETYLWSPAGQVTVDITVRTAGDYSVTISDEHGCQSDASDPVTVTVNSITRPVITIDGSTAFCEGSASPTLSTDEAFAYEWSSGETTRNISVTESGTYTVRVFDNLGHPSEPSDPVSISVYPNPDAILAGKTDVLCYGETAGAAEISASGGTAPYTYAWSGGQTGTQASGLGAGQYLVTVTDANQCLDTVHFTINQPEAILIQESITHPYCEDAYDGSIEVSISGGTPGYSIAWSEGSSGSLLQGLGPGTWDLEVTDANLCIETAFYTLANREETCVKVPGIITPNNDGYNDAWRIPGIEYYPDATVEIYDRWGKQVFFSRGYEQPWDGTLDGKLLPMDSYHYVIKLNNGSPALVGNITIVK